MARILNSLLGLVSGVVVAIIDLCLPAWLAKAIALAAERRGGDPESIVPLRRFARRAIPGPGVIPAPERGNFDVTSLIADPGIVGFASQDAAEDFVAGMATCSSAPSPTWPL